MSKTVRILRGTALGGVGNDVYPGETLTLPDGQALALIAAGRAVEADAESVQLVVETKKPKQGRKQNA